MGAGDGTLDQRSLTASPSQRSKSSRISSFRSRSAVCSSPKNARNSPPGRIFRTIPTLSGFSWICFGPHPCAGLAIRPLRIRSRTASPHRSRTIGRFRLAGLLESTRDAVTDADLLGDAQSVAIRSMLVSWPSPPAFVDNNLDSRNLNHLA